MSTLSDKGEGVVAGDGLPRHKAKRGAVQGHRGSRKRLLLGADPMGAGARRKGASKAAKSKPKAQLKDVNDRFEALADRMLSGELERTVKTVVLQVLNVKLRTELRAARAGARVPRRAGLEFMREKRG